MVVNQRSRVFIHENLPDAPALRALDDFEVMCTLWGAEGIELARFKGFHLDPPGQGSSITSAPFKTHRLRAGAARAPRPEEISRAIIADRLDFLPLRPSKLPFRPSEGARSRRWDCIRNRRLR